MFNAFKKLQKRETKDIPINFAFPLLRWSSSSPKNLLVCNKLNKLFFYCKPKIILDLLGLGIKPVRFIKYPKKKKEDVSQLTVLQEIFYKKYKWSKREFNLYKTLILQHNAEDIEGLATKIGLDNKKRKILKLTVLKSVAKPKKKNKTLFNF